MKPDCRISIIINTIRSLPEIIPVASRTRRLNTLAKPLVPEFLAKLNFPKNMTITNFKNIYCKALIKFYGRPTSWEEAHGYGMLIPLILLQNKATSMDLQRAVSLFSEASNQWGSWRESLRISSSEHPRHPSMFQRPQGPGEYPGEHHPQHQPPGTTSKQY